jgi:hypothetical protein
MVVSLRSIKNKKCCYKKKNLCTETWKFHVWLLYKSLPKWDYVVPMSIQRVGYLMHAIWWSERKEFFVKPPCLDLQGSKFKHSSGIHWLLKMKTPQSFETTWSINPNLLHPTVMQNNLHFELLSVPSCNALLYQEIPSLRVNIAKAWI